MAKVNATTLKGYFNTGDTPTESNFVDLIESCLNTETPNGGGHQVFPGNFTEDTTFFSIARIEGDRILRVALRLRRSGSVSQGDMVARLQNIDIPENQKKSYITAYGVTSSNTPVPVCLMFDHFTGEFYATDAFTEDALYLDTSILL